MVDHNAEAARDQSVHTNESPMPDSLFVPRSRLGKKMYGFFVEPLIGSKDPPWIDARGVAIGLIVGFGTPVGAHTAAVCLLRLAFRFNFIAALAFTWVCNPFNVAFLYYGYYHIGSTVLGRPAALDFHVFEKLILPIADKSHFWEALSEFTQLGEDLLLRWSVAAVLLAVIFGAIGYAVTYHIQKKRCKKAAKQMGIRYEKLVKLLETKSGTGR
ncbi:MAG TPA: DUF2062 domain-containing protein [Desulfomonilaceae bacterium]|nr:DUF2062 domain-containing protein [Desulfomonilaceae bacterium]